MPDELTFVERVRRQAASRPLTFVERVRQEVSTQEEYDPWQAEFQQARAKLEGSPLPGMYAFGVQAGAPIVSGIARLLGQGAYADTMNRTAARIEQAQREREKGGPIPDVLQSGLRGAGASAVTMFGAGMVGGPPAAIGVASAQEANRAITEGKDAGLAGKDLIGYAVAQGVVEGVPAAAMQRVGLGGVESLVGKRAVSTGVGDALKKFGVQFTAEQIEEQVTEHTHNVVSALSSVDPEALSPESIRQTAYETAVQTTFAMGIGHAVTAGRPRNVAGTHAEMEAYAKERKTPSRRVYKRWNLGPGLPGDSVSQRREIIQEMGRQLEASDTQGAQEAQEAAVAPEGPEGVLGPEAAQGAEVEPQGALTGGEEVQIEPGQAQEVAHPALAPREGDNSGQALNRAQGNKIMLELGVPPLDPAVHRPWPMVADEVATGKLDEKALENAAEILRTRRGGTDTEHLAMAIKAGKLMDERNRIKAEQSAAATRNDDREYNRLTKKLKGTRIGELSGISLGLNGQIELLARADAYAGTAPAQSISIRQIELSRESYDVANVIQDYQAAKGPDAVAMTSEETDTAGEHSDAILKAQAEVDETTETIEVEGVVKAKAAAQKILDSIKRQGGGTGRGAIIKTKAAKEIDVIKARIKALGEVGRVNDILGISAEGSYLIGRLGIAYIKSGVGTLVEVAEGLRLTFPDLNLTDRDIWDALVASNPKLESRLRTKAQKDVSQIKSMSRMLIEIDDISKGVATKKPANAREVLPEIKQLNKQLTKLRNEFYKADFDKAKLERAIDTVNRLQDILDDGKKGIKREPQKTPPELTAQKEMAKQLRRELDINTELESINRQIETGIYEPPKGKKKKPIDPRLQRKQIELYRKKRELQDWIAAAAPWDIKRGVREVAALMKSMKATADVSFTLRQNVWHPFKTLGVGQKAKFIKKAVKGELTVDDKFFPSLRALLNEYSADQIRSSMVNGENGFLYAKHGLAILDPHSVGDKDRSEIFQNNVIERSNRKGLKIWGAVMRASSRHAVTIGNMVRTSVFDQFLANNPNATDAELTSFANYANVTTGIGNLGRFGAIADELNLALFSPKFAASRPATMIHAALSVQPWIGYHRKLPRVRKAIARDMVRNVGTGLLVLGLADLAGLGVEWWDPDDPDWGSIRFRNTRWDIFGGIKQFARLIARTAKYPFKEEGDKGMNPWEMASRSISYKASPILTTSVELFTGETVIGKEVDPPDWMADVTGEGIGKRLVTLTKVPIPIVHEDIYDAMEQEGALLAIGAAVTTLPGISTQSYQDSRTAAIRKIKILQGRGDYAGASKYKQNWIDHNNKLPPGKREKTIGIVKPKKSRK